MKIGDEVCCINPTGELVKDKKYYIYNIVYNPCGCGSVDVGIKHQPTASIMRYHCHKHYNSYHDELGNIRWFGLDRFAPIQHNSDEFLSSDKIEKSADEKIDIKLPKPIEQE